MQDSATGTLCVAAVLVSVGRERALKLLERFDPAEVERLGNQASSLGSIDREKLDAISLTFERDFGVGTGLLHSGRSFASLLEGTRREEEDEAPEAPVDPWAAVHGVPLAELAKFLAAEHPAAAAVVLKHSGPTRSMALLKEMEEDEQAIILQAMLEIEPSDLAIETVLAALQPLIASGGAGADGSAGESDVASIFSALDAAASERLLRKMEERVDKARLDRISTMVFRFEDIATLDASARAKVVEGADRGNLTLALAEASDELRESLLSTLGQRGRRMVEGELATAGNVRPEAQEEARAALVAAVRQLAEDGVIELRKTQD